MDENQQQLEGEAVLKGEAAAKAKLLIEQLESDALSTDRVRIAAYLGDAASREALKSKDDPVLPDEPDWNWPMGVAMFESEAAVRVALAAARYALGLDSREVVKKGLLSRLRRDPSAKAKALVAAIDRWLERKDGERLNAITAALNALGTRLVDKRYLAVRAAGEAAAEAGRLEQQKASEQAAETAARLAAHAAMETLLAMPDHPPLPGELYKGTLQAGEFETHRDLYSRFSWELHEKQRDYATRRVIEAIRREVVAWALTPKAG